MQSIEVMAIKPAREGYCFVKNEGRHGDVRLANALGSNYAKDVSLRKSSE